MNVRVANNSNVYEILKKSGVPNEPETFNPTKTTVFKFPVTQGPVKPAEHVSIWEQANLLVMLQREWADNSVSNTLYFRPKWKLTKHLAVEKEYLKLVTKHKLDIDDNRVVINGKTKYVLFREKWPLPGQDPIQLKIYKYDPNHEEDLIEPVLASIAPLIKSCSLLPHSAKGVYRQMPQEGLTPVEFNKLSKRIKKIDWSKLTGTDAHNEDDKYCSGPSCTIPLGKK